jgi:hypothetical protein
VEVEKYDILPEFTENADINAGKPELEPGALFQE